MKYNKNTRKQMPLDNRLMKFMGEPKPVPEESKESSMKSKVPMTPQVMGQKVSDKELPSRK